MVGAAALGVLAAPGAALAACAVTTAGNVDCASTVTTNTTSTITVSGSYSDYQLIFNSGVAVTGDTQPGAVVSGVGFRITQAAAAPQTLSFNNQGLVTTNFPGSGLELDGNGGLVSYTGNGSAISTDLTGAWAGLTIFNKNAGGANIGSALVPVTGAFSGANSGIYVGEAAGSPDIFNGPQNIFLAGGSVTSLLPGMTALFGDARSGAGTVFIQTTGGTILTATSTGTGLSAHSGSGTATVISDANVGTASAFVGTGMRATVDSGPGAVSITETGGRIFANTRGILASSGGSGNVSVALTGAANILAMGNGSWGIIGISGAGSLGVSIGAGTSVTGGAGAISLTTSALATLNNFGTLNAGGAFIDAPVIVQTGGSSLITNNASGLINGTINLSGSTGPNSFSNSGVWNTSWTSSFGPGADSLTNGVGGVINVSGCGAVPCAFNFGGGGLDSVINAGTFNSGLLATDRLTYNFSTNGDNSFTNTGVLNVAGSLTFNGLSSFNNAGGLLDLRQGALGNLNTDVVTMSGGFAGGTGSRLGLNAFLGGAGSTADQLHVGGGLTGTTSIIVADTNPGLGGFTGKAGIPLITVGGSSATATLRLDDASTVIGGHYLDLGSSGVLVKGLFDYVLTDVPGGYSLISVPGQGLSEAPIAVTGAKTIWYETATDWDQRQLHLHDGSAGAWGVRADGNVGVWLDGVGSWANRTDHQTAANGPASLPVNLSYRQNVYGVLGGIDAGWSHLAGANDSLQIGVLGGYVSSGLDFSAGGGFDYSGGLAGLSATYLNGGFFFSGLGKVDVLRLSLGDQAGFAGGSAQSITWGGLGTAGYHFTFGAGFVEPLATLAGTSTSIGGIDLRGEGVGIDFYRATTFRGALGVRFGGLIEEGPGCKLTASGMARVWQPFGRDEGWATISNPGLPFDLIDRFDRTYGDVSGRLDYVAKGTGFSASAKLGVKFADRYSDLNVGADLHWRW